MSIANTAKPTATAPGRPAAWPTLHRIFDEQILIWGGGRALLLQLAHPAVAAGVAQHSNWKKERYQRLWRTLWLMNRLIYGRAHVKQQAARTINRRHQPVRGDVSAALPAEPAQPYRASDPALAWWVLATLIDTGRVGFERWVRPLTPAEQTAFYRESIELAAYFGIRPQHCPPNYAAFLAYMDGMFTGPTLRYPEETRAMAHELFNLPWPARPQAYAFTMLTLPDSVRHGYGFEWTPAQAERWTRREQRLTRLYQRTPHPLRQNWLARLIERM